MNTYNRGIRKKFHENNAWLDWFFETVKISIDFFEMKKVDKKLILNELSFTKFKTCENTQWKSEN